MFCPSCGTESNGDIKYCTKCGVNLRRIKGVMGKGGGGDHDRMKWEQVALEEWKEHQEQKRKKSPEEKRLEEVKAGVIVSVSGLGGMIFLWLLLGAIASAAEGPGASILRAVPAAGLIPFLVGLGMIFNGLVISKRIVQLRREEEERTRPQQQPVFSAPATSPVPRLSEGEPSAVADFSIAEPTTRSLREPAPVPRDTN